MRANENTEEIGEDEIDRMWKGSLAKYKNSKELVPGVNVPGAEKGFAG
jgi:hypothetical protein